MKLKCLCILLFLLASFPIYAQWEDQNSGIDDNLTGIVFVGDTGVVTGDNGVYYTTDGTTWQRFEITDNSDASTLYNNSFFTACSANPASDPNAFTVYAVGMDPVNNRSVLMSLEFPSMDYKIINPGSYNKAFRDIDYRTSYDYFYVVGDTGSMVYFRDDITTVQYIYTGTSKNLTSVDFIPLTGSGLVGSEDQYFNVPYVDELSDPIETPGITHQDVSYSYGGVYSVGSQYHKLSSNISLLNNYDYGPLNANVIFEKDSRHFIATDHGIFVSTPNKEILEWQPSAGTSQVNAFWTNNPDDNSTLYACGPNGLILKNDTPSDEAQPYVVIEFEGDCANEDSVISSIDSYIGSSSSCQWYVDGVETSQNCNSFNHTFPALGQYEIKLEVTHNGLVTERTKTIDIVRVPEIDKPITITDEILCHAEPLEIQIEDSETDVFYTLKREGTSGNFGVSQVSPGGTLVFNTNLLSETGNYYLTATNSIVPSCPRSFTERFEIIVEQTEASFHAGLLNASLDEPIPFYQNSLEASIFDWQFSGPVATSSSSLENPINSYATTGTYDITLTATSAEGCVDDITKQGPHIYEEPSDDQSCWFYTLDSPIDSGSEDNVTSFTQLDDGYLTTGSYVDETFGSNHGISIDMEGKGGYLSKHDFKGTLKWLVHFTGFTFDNYKISDSEVDSEGNIYIAFNVPSSAATRTFYDNTGKKLNLMIGGYVIKLSSKGELIWHMRIERFFPRFLTIDNEDNIIINGGYDIYNHYSHEVYLNDVQTDYVGTYDVYPYAQAGYVGTIKSTPNGEIVWDIEVVGNHLNNYIIEITFDQNNNYYFFGRYSGSVDIFDPVNSESTYINTHAAPAGTYNYIFKFDNQGQFSWYNRFYSEEEGVDGWESILGYDIKTDAEGNSYVTGNTSLYNSDLTHHYVSENSDGSFFEVDHSKAYFLQKINAEGFTQWVVGTDIDDPDNSPTPSGLRIDLVEDKIHVFGAENFATEQVDITFNSTDNSSATATLDGYDVFVGVYDTNGVPEKILVFEDVNPDYALSSYSFFSRNAEEHYLGRSFRVSGSHDYFGKVDYLNNNCAVVYGNTLSTDEFNSTQVTSVYPNPSDGQLTLRIDQSYSEIKIKIYNVLGQSIFEEEYDQYRREIPINFEGKNGIYIIEFLIDDQHKVVKKIMKH